MFFRRKKHSLFARSVYVNNLGGIYNSYIEFTSKEWTRIVLFESVLHDKCYLIKHIHC